MSYNFFKTKVISIGDLALGGNHPVRVQSMLNTPTLDTEKCVAQSIKLIEAGCEYIRITAPGMSEAENILNIKKILKQKSFNTPIIADVHYNAKIAEYCARYLEKVRINPGNYADKKILKKISYTDIDYYSELERIAKRLSPLLKICKEYGTAIRIGTNHGSLSDRIKNRYGDTPAGMVEATMEFIRICNDFGFNNLVVSLKASNPVIMIEANRLLVKQMCKENLCFPIHLGVTEAGEGEDGRIKSALGIGTLLSEGIGNTIRVSLTENPVYEIPFAKEIVKIFKNKQNFIKSTDVTNNFVSLIDVELQENLKHPFILLKLNNTKPELLAKIFTYNNTTHCFDRHDTSPDALLISHNIKPENINPQIKIIQGLFHPITEVEKHKKGLTSKKTTQIAHLSCKLFNDKWLIETTVELGKLLLTHKIKGILPDVIEKKLPAVLNTVFGILQASRVRISKTEYISCPTCGRTSYDLTATLKRIKNATGHLHGLKIAVMGCIVNGPGEMADADYGYVGAGKGKINLYKGKNAILKNISEKEALPELINILKQDGFWKEK